MTLDTDFVRAQFPAFAEPSLAGQAFFENAGGSYTCATVIARLERYYRQRKVQPYAPYEASQLAGAEMDEARSRLAAMMGVAADELSFGPSTTQNTYVLAQAFRQWMEPGDAIIVTNQDHEANSGPWRRLADAGFEVREWKACSIPRIWKTCSMTGCGWCVSRIAPMSSARSTRWSRSQRWPMPPVPLSVSMGSVMRHMACRMWGGWGRIFTSFPPTRPMARIRASW